VTWDLTINYGIRGKFKLISNLVPTACKKQLYYAYIYSRVQYGIEVHGKAGKKHLKKIQVMQNHLLKMLYKLDKLTPTTGTYSQHQTILQITCN
jgi:hypothetical protein